ncbi:MAG TPA: carboxypeptidase-like regulatory domain-containing protein, partial [Gemmatimonadaceae bacterium]
RGRVTDDSARAIAATVIVTRGPDRLVQQTMTDSGGAFHVRFDPGTGDYLVFVSAPGFASARRRVQRQGTEHELIANFTLQKDLALLAAVNVRAAKPVRATNRVDPTFLETGASEKWQDGVQGQIPPTVTGDLNAVAGTMSNVTMTPSGPSILGSGSGSNLTTLNGMGLAAGSIPRAANTQTRVTGATFDPTRGGFSGSNIDVELGPGDRFYQRRRGFLTLAPEATQFTDAVGRSVGAQTGSIRGSLGADGELIRDALTYNVAVDLAHSVSQPSTLLDAGNDVFLRAGIAPDSVSRLFGIATPLGLALAGHGVPTSQQHDAFSWLGRLDDTRDTLATRALTSYATYTRDGALGFAPLTAPSASGERTQQALGAQLTIGNYVGEGRRVLVETRLAASAVKTHVTPYERLPGANVLVLSPALDGSTDVSNLALGGGQSLATDDSRWTLEGSNQTTWNANGRRNHFKALLWARADGLRQSGIPNQLGSYTFNSLSDLAAGNADSYSRTLSQPDRSGTVWNAAAALAHEWAPSRTFSLLYGARLEADGFGSAPARDVALENALGVRSDVTPSRIHISPRAGFSYTYSRDRQNGSGETVTEVGTFYRNTVGVIRGGAGEFRDLLHPDILANASAATGLPNGESLLSCVGAAVPTPDWSLFASDPATIPTRCISGSGILAEQVPAVSIISPSYDVPRSWRASLDWSSNFNTWLLHVAALGSYDLSQPGIIDVNFTGVPQFTLGDEGNRPVFVSPGAVDPSSGVVSPTQARKSPDFGRVAMLTSDLRGYGGQITTTLSPDVFKFRTQFSLFTSLSYTLQESRRQYRGFDGAAFGDPRVIEWAPSNNDARHIIVLSAGFNTPKTGTLTLFARLQSGLPFTPIVQGDVNGDGISGDRAFIPDPAKETDTVLASQLRSLIANGSTSARKCVLANLGQVAPRNGCRGPWTALLNLQWSPPFPSRWLGRVTPNVYFENVLGGVDQLLHGSNGLRGWGTQPVINPVLLVPSGFNPATKTFGYTVNPRFADTRAINTLTRNPFRITLDFTFDLSTDFALQQLRRAVEPVRAPNGNGWTRRSADSLTAFYLTRTSSIYKMLLANSDSLFLSKAQTALLQHDDSVYSARVRTIYGQLGDFLAARGAAEPGKAELDSAKNIDKAYWKIFWQQPEIADSAITPSQRELMPLLKNMLAVPLKEREHSQWEFGNPVTFADKPRPVRN